jgi:hypothetical protein
MTGICNQLISISDLEGCFLKSSSGQDQHVVLCANETFDSIKEYLISDAGNHIAFLGDYFDNGPHMSKSIKGIVDCHKQSPEQVHIILGNRDINKMRIAVEKDIDYVTYPPNIEKIWETWKTNPSYAFTTFDPKRANTPLERTKHLLDKTYGAKMLLQNIATELKIKDDDALNLFASIFLNDSTQHTDVEKEFVENCRYLFDKGKIMEKVKVGEKNVLLSHGGSFSKRIFTSENITTINAIKVDMEEDKIPPEFTVKDSTNYYEKMEACRKIIDNKEDTVMEYDKTPSETIDQVISSYNTFYSMVLTYLKSIDVANVETIRNNYSYHMLQSNPLAKSGSPVSNCVLSANCNSATQIKPIPQFLQDYFNHNQIHIISHGHIPFCGTVPLIYKNGDIIYVSNDTSNGNRPLYTGHDVKLKNVPLSLITATSVGICSLNDDGSTNQSDTKEDSKHTIHAYRNYDLPNHPDYYRKFVTTYNYNDKFLDYTYINRFFQPDPNKRFQPMFNVETREGIGVYEPESDPERFDVFGGRSKKSKKYRKSISCFKCGNSCCKCCAKSKKRNKKSKKTRKTVKKLNQHKRRNRTLSNKRKNRYSK